MGNFIYGQLYPENMTNLYVFLHAAVQHDKRPWLFVHRYERDGKQEMLAECRERLRELEEKAEQLSSARDQVTAKIVATRQKLDTQKVRGPL